MIMSSTETTGSPFEVATDCLVRYVELWVPHEQRDVLVLKSAMRCASVDTSSAPVVSTASGKEVGLGEGIAGAAWKQKSATILQEEPSDVLRKISEDSGVELASVLAIPVFQQQQVMGVAVFGLGPGHGAVEVWSRDERDELAVTAGHYAGLPSFEFITRYTRFPKGAGVPGKVWQTGAAKLAQNLESSASFIRSFGKDPAVICTAIGLPVASANGFPSSVLLLLAAENVPLAPHLELWECAPQKASNAEAGPDTLSITNVESVDGIECGTDGWRQTVLEHLAATGQPLVIESGEGFPSGAGFVVSLPVYRGSDISGVLNFMF